MVDEGMVCERRDSAALGIIIRGQFGRFIYAREPHPSPVSGESRGDAGRLVGNRARNTLAYVFEVANYAPMARTQRAFAGTRDRWILWMWHQIIGDEAFYRALASSEYRTSATGSRPHNERFLPIDQR